MNKTITINTNDYSKYIVTGTLVSGARFRIVTESIRHALGINLWNGSVWAVKKFDGKRIRIKRVIN